jgi:ATP-dependent Clp protease ATP-binding subunit ClpA
MTITKELETTLELAFAEARRRRHEYVTLEHLLYALCLDPVAGKVIKGCGGSVEKILSSLNDFFAKYIKPSAGDEEVEPAPTAAFTRALQRAAMHVQGTGKEAIDGAAVLVSLLREHESFAVHILQQHQVRRLDVLRFVSHGIAKEGGPRSGSAGRGGDEGSQSPFEGDEGETTADEEEAAAEDDPLARWTINLNELAKKGSIDPLIGRRNELERMVQVLCRRRKNNPVLVGDPGVGKTAIVWGLALAIHEQKVPKVLDGCTVYSLDMGSLLAGTKFRGDFEQRLKGVIKAIQKDKQAILFIDEIHTIVGAGATSGGSMDASNLLKPALAAGELRCIGSTTFNEYKQSFERDKALGRRFQKIEVYEPTVEETVEILRGLRSRYEEHHEVKYTDGALRASAELSAKYVNDRFLPDKAIDVLDEAGASQRLVPASQRKQTIDEHDVERVVAKMAKIPEKTVSASDEEQLGRLDGELKKVIYGQDAAIDTLVAAIKLSRAGLGSPEKPIGNFLFSGPTGVGKTELAKQMARILGVEFIRFDMTEYMEKHTVSRLIGAPPGYVGFDQGGLLTDAIRKTPYAVLLLDEIEKAHPDLYNILLQVMDHATLTDNNGRKADFRHVILILTTNAGARDLASRGIGFGGTVAPGGTTAQRSKEAIERTFSPEFRNRLDAWIAFEPLGMPSILRVVDKLVGELRRQLADKGIQVVLDDDARRWLAEKGFDPMFGARPMARLIQNELKKPLADAILFGPLKKGGEVKVGVQDGKLRLDLPALVPA